MKVLIDECAPRALKTFLTNHGHEPANSDSEAGLYYYRARYYDPAPGRFITEDPASSAVGSTSGGRVAQPLFFLFSCGGAEQIPHPISPDPFYCCGGFCAGGGAAVGGPGAFAEDCSAGRVRFVRIIYSRSPH